MKRFFPLVLIAATIACNTQSPEPAAETAETTSATAHEYSVKSRYSSDWEMGDPQQAEAVIALWKHFDNNTLDSVRSLLADSLYMEGPAWAMKLQSDSALAGAKADRAQFSSLKTEIDAIIPLKAKDHPEETVVTIWGEEIGIMGGKEIKRKIHEVWSFNKDGKVSS
ncbi:MAG TPA: hypothetical protein VFX73_07150, partial [Chitinophagaceae bacterium]|nr:hypothetical protein [Chitinophagaceae bacterium]